MSFVDMTNLSASKWLNNGSYGNTCILQFFSKIIFAIFCDHFLLVSS